MSEEKNRGLALSGGGTRATLFHLGVIRINNETF
jgi:predicted acylesterase/phospholipase RssA